MNQTREIKNFIFSQYFSDGLRITLGVLLPSVILAQFGQLETGIVVSLGALNVSIADSPGPPLHKRNGMLLCIVLVFITALITSLINKNPYLLMIEIPVLCFLFSMITVYGTRASFVGTAALLTMVLSIDRIFTIEESLEYSLLILGGAVWYFLLSISIITIRPYRMVQQNLGACMREISEYLKIKADFYDSGTNYDDNYRKLILKQVIVNQELDSVRELIFKTRQIVNESTKVSRQLLSIFVDVVDLFERTMATHYDYQEINKTYGKTDALSSFHNIITKIAEELESLSYYVTSNEKPIQLFALQPDLEHLKSAIDKVETEHGLNNLVLKKILVNVRNIVTRIQKIYSYFKEQQFPTGQATKLEISRFTSHQDYDFKLFNDNLTFQSSIFRHSIRVALVCLVGYLCALSFPLGHHSYWILLTILVILKPGFSLTKQRNYHRLIGTIIGGIIGAVIVYYIKDEKARFVLLLLFMIGTYSFLRLNYVLSVVFMTPYILIMFSFIGLGGLSIVQERIFDTIFGSAIAFIASYFIFPSWESTQLKGFMRNTMVANYNYLVKSAERIFGGQANVTEYKLARKELYISSANLGAAFQRMLSEPKSKQKNAKDVHKFVVLNHILSSYISTLYATLNNTDSVLVNPIHIKLIKRSLKLLSESISKLTGSENDFNEVELNAPENSLQLIEESPDTKLITEQLEFVHKITKDIQAITIRLQDE